MEQMVQPQTSARRFLKQNPVVDAACKAFGESARMIVSEARATRRSIDAVLSDCVGQPVQVEAYGRRQARQARM